jgi:hypothetical protein
LESNELKLQEILKARGITDEQLKEVQEQDIPAAAGSFQRIMDIYYLLKVTTDMESAYWYNRVWWENDGDLLEVRRAKAVAASLAHSTPTILPYEKLVMNKTKHLRGAFPFPWVCASFFNSLAESLMEEAEAPAENEADSVSVVGAGGGNNRKLWRSYLHYEKIWYAERRHSRSGKSIQILGRYFRRRHFHKICKNTSRL